MTFGWDGPGIPVITFYKMSYFFKYESLSSINIACMLMEVEPSFRVWTTDHCPRFWRKLTSLAYQSLAVSISLAREEASRISPPSMLNCWLVWSSVTIALWVHEWDRYATFRRQLPQHTSVPWGTNMLPSPLLCCPLSFGMCVFVVIDAPFRTEHSQAYSQSRDQSWVPALTATHYT